MKILMSAFSCGPDTGSEPGIGWNWALEAARQGHTITVLTQSEFQTEIEAALAQSRVPENIKFVFFTPRWLELLRDYGLRSPLSGITWQIVHLLWQIILPGFVKKQGLHKGCDIIHHITLGGIRHPTRLYKLDLPLVVGPLGGGERAPMALRKSFSWRGWLKDFVRDIHTSLLTLDPITRSACHHALVVYAKTRHSKSALPAKDPNKVRVAFELGTYAKSLSEPPATKKKGPIRLLYAGQFIYWKGMDIGLKAIAEARRQGADIELTLLGDGPEKARWQSLAETLGLKSHVHWPGLIPHSEMVQAYRTHDILLFPSLHDSSGNVVIEAFTNGLPVVCLNLGGPAEMVNETCGHVVPSNDCTLEQCTHRVADTIVKLSNNREQIEELRHGALCRAKDFTWQKVVGSLYQDVMTRLPEGRQTEQEDITLTPASQHSPNPM